MASTNKTPNYDLPQWVETDKPEMADFNTAFEDIDTNINLVQQEIDEVKNKDKCRAYATTNQTLPTDTLVKINFTNESFDTNHMHNNATNNNRITIKRSGYYLVHGMIHFSPSAVGNRYLYIYKNNTSIARVEHGLANNNGQRTQITIVEFFEVNDYIEMAVYQDSTITLNSTGSVQAPSLTVIQMV